MSEPTHPCRLYLLIAHDAGTETLAAFEQALNAGDVGCAALRCAPDGTADRALAEKLLAIAAAHDVAFLVESDVACAKQTGADGVHVMGDEGLYEAARDALGEDAIVGAVCGLSRHAALTLAENGADYIAMAGDAGPRKEMIAWWAEIVEVPSVAWTAETLEEARALARAGADFVAVDETLWRAGGNPGETVAALNNAIGTERNAA